MLTVMISDPSSWRNRTEPYMYRCYLQLNVTQDQNDLYATSMSQSIAIHGKRIRRTFFVFCCCCLKDGRKQLLAEHKGKGDSSEGGDEPEERESISWDVIQ